jgi:hypothetical protein
MKKILILTISLIGTLSLTGCDGGQVGVGNFGCVGNTTSVACNGSVAYRKTWKSSDGSFDASLAKINLSQSNVSLVATSGTLLLSIKNTSGSVVASSVFNWYSVGDYIYPSAKSSMTNWVNANLQNDYVIDFDISGIETDGQLGNNTLTAIFEYDGLTIGASDSFYLNNADINRF